MNQQTFSFFFTASDEELVRWLLNRRLISDEMLCTSCGVLMSMKGTPDSSLFLNWRCMNYQCDHYQTTKSPLLNSFFEGFRIKPRDCLKVLILLLNGEQLVTIAKYVNIGKVTLLKIKQKIVSNVRNYFAENPIKLGGPGSIVQVDETMLSHAVRSHRGRAPNHQTWAITMCDTDQRPAVGYCEVVENRSAQTLIPIIYRVVRSGSIIYTDEWRAYNELRNNMEYEHQTLTHKYNFVDPSTGVHTQNVESFNNKLKLIIKKNKGCGEDKRKDLIDLFLFCDYFKERAFEKFIEIIKI